MSNEDWEWAERGFSPNNVIKDNTDDSFISRWEDFGMKYRGRWVPTNTYNKQDVVWMHLNKPNGKPNSKES